MKNLILCICFTMMTGILGAIEINHAETRYYFNVGAGIAYDFNINSEFLARDDVAFFDVPFSLDFDVRFHENVSIGSGINAVYSYHRYSLNGFSIQNHNMFIDIPLNFKFYPLAGREDSHYFFYCGAGIFVRLWAVNRYIMSSSSVTYEGNSYTPDNEYIQPGECYTPVNVGTQVSIGNVLKLNDIVGFGLEINAKYLFMPFINGYLTSPAATNEDGQVYLNFMASTGIKLFISFDITKDSI